MITKKKIKKKITKRQVHIRIMNEFIARSHQKPIQ